MGGFPHIGEAEQEIIMNDKFISGFLFTLAGQILFRDFLGMEQYVVYVTNNWIDPWISVPLALAALVASYRFYMEE